MKYGAIDMGTNSVRLLIAEVESNMIVSSYKTLETTRIGENVDKTGEISTEAINRTIEALKKFKQLTEKQGLASVPIIATSAVRDSNNKQVLVDRVKLEVKMDLDIISGIREAELGFYGVLRGLEDNHEDILVIDIGGGSTELIVGSKTGIKFLTSMDIGAVRMTEKFLSIDTVTEQEIDNLVEHIDDVIEKEMIEIKKLHFNGVIGIGGTATTLAAVDQSLLIYDQDKIQNYSLSKDKIKIIYEKFVRKTIEDRKKIPGLQPRRADVIIAGTIILIRIMELLKIDSVIISEYDNLEGLVFEQLESDK